MTEQSCHPPGVSDKLPAGNVYAPPMRRVLLVGANARDRLNLAHPELRSRFEIVEAPVAGAHPREELERILAEVEPGSIDGVIGSNDRTAHLAAHIAHRLGLPGPSPASFMACHDKLAARRIQTELVPEATPRFAAIDPFDATSPGPSLPFPFFVKPVTGHLSQLAYTIHDAEELASVLREARDHLEAIAAFDDELEGASFRTLLAEELLTGDLVTFEGFMRDGELTTVGVTDSIMHPNGISFVRFDYPSTVAGDVQARMAAISQRLMRGIGFDGSLFNVEFFVGPDGDPRIVEVNGRMASQFAPLVRALHGVSTYEVQLELATGGTPTLPPRGNLVASSFVVRHYEDAIVETVPDPAPILERFPHAQVELLVHPGQRLSDNDDDVVSHRLALVALAGRTRDEVRERMALVEGLLRFDLIPVDA